MSDLGAIVTAAAAKAATVTGIAGASDGGLWEIPGFPFALAYANAGTGTQSGLTILNNEIEIRVYIPKAGLPGAYLALLAFPDLFEVAWRTDRDLGGTCLDSWYSGHGKVDVEVWGGDPRDPSSGTPYLFIPIRIGVLRTLAADLSP